MTLFAAVKANVTPREAAERYGIKVDRYGRALCPFHDDHHPSMQLDDKRWRCWSCSPFPGDVIDLTAKLFGLSPVESAKKLAADFAVPYDGVKPSPEELKAMQEAKTKKAEQLRLLEAEKHFFIILCDYAHMLRIWKVDHAPMEIDDADELFAEAVRNLAEVEALLDAFLDADDEGKKDILIKYGKRVKRLEDRVNKLKEDEGRPGRSGGSVRAGER